MPIYYNENTPVLGNANVDALQVLGRKAAGSVVPLTGNTAVSKVLEIQSKLVDAAAATTSAEHVLYSGTLNVTVTKVSFAPDAALTANDTNFGSIVLATRNADGSTNATISTTATRITGGTGNWTAFLNIDLAVSNVQLTSGMSLTMAITKTGTGVVIPAGSFIVEGTLT